MARLIALPLNLKATRFAKYVPFQKPAVGNGRKGLGNLATAEGVPANSLISRKIHQDEVLQNPLWADAFVRDVRLSMTVHCQSRFTL